MQETSLLSLGSLTGRCTWSFASSATQAWRSSFFVSAGESKVSQGSRSSHVVAPLAILFPKGSRLGEEVQDRHPSLRTRAIAEVHCATNGSDVRPSIHPSIHLSLSVSTTLSLSPAPGRAQGSQSPKEGS